MELQGKQSFFLCSYYGWGIRWWRVKVLNSMIVFYGWIIGVVGENWSLSCYHVFLFVSRAMDVNDFFFLGMLIMVWRKHDLIMGS